jgi:putative transposase
LDGRRLLRSSRSNYARSNNPVLHRPVELAQYTSIAFTTRLLDAGVDPSVGSVGDAYDNALAETTVGSFKNELIRRQGPWRGVDHIEIETLNWVDWFNTERPHKFLDDLTPARIEEHHYAHKHALAAAG